MTTMLMKLINDYNEVAYAHHYIWGFEFKGTVYMAITDSTCLPFVCKLDRASRGAGMALRFCPTTDQKVALMAKAEPLCSVKYFAEMCDSCKYNKGETFEKMVTEYFGQEWVKDNVPFTKAGDIEVDGIAYQIKYQRATFCNEKSIANLKK